MFEKLERQRLSELVADDLEEAILSGKIGIGERLPSEQKLASQVGVSRNVVREAFKFLQERGLIEILNGSGAYVSSPNHRPTTTALGRYLRLVSKHLIGPDSSIAALYEARRTLEGSNARIAAVRAQPSDLEHMAECLQRMRNHEGSIERWTEADLDFHLAIARATHNPFLQMLLEPLVSQLRSVIAEGYLAPGAAETGLASHVKIYTCIKNRDAEGAYIYIIDHLRDSQARIELVLASATGSGSTSNP